jgi:hypothetical protein
VDTEDVNAAAGEYDSTKRQEFKTDTLDDHMTLDTEFQKLRRFCLEGNNTKGLSINKVMAEQVDGDPALLN